MEALYLNNFRIAFPVVFPATRRPTRLPTLPCLPELNPPVSVGRCPAHCF